MTKGNLETFGDYRYVNYLDFVNDFTVIYIYEKFRNLFMLLYRGCQINIYKWTL